MSNTRKATNLILKAFEHIVFKEQYWGAYEEDGDVIITECDEPTFRYSDGKFIIDYTRDELIEWAKRDGIPSDMIEASLKQYDRIERKARAAIREL